MLRLYMVRVAKTITYPLCLGVRANLALSNRKRKTSRRCPSFLLSPPFRSMDYLQTMEYRTRPFGRPSRHRKNPSRPRNFPTRPLPHPLARCLLLFGLLLLRPHRRPQHFHPRHMARNGRSGSSQSNPLHRRFKLRKARHGTSLERSRYQTSST